MAYKENFEQTVNDGRTGLSVAIDAAQTTLAVGNASTFPTVGNFRVIVDAEIMLVTAVAGNIFTVVRGVEGTSAAVHDLGATLNSIITEASLNQTIKDHTPFHNAKPQLSSLTNGAGANLTVADFTWVNQGGAGAVDIALGSIIKTIPRSATNGPDLRVLAKSPPSTPYTVTAIISHSANGVVDVTGPTEDIIWSGLGFRENATGKLSAVYAANRQGVRVSNYTDPTTLAGDVYTHSLPNLMNATLCFYQIEDDGANVAYRISNNGIEWIELFSQGRAVHFTTAPDQVCYISNGRHPSAQGSTTNHRSVLLHWSEA